MKNVNRYYNKIRKITANGYHKELHETLLTAVEEYEISEQSVIKELLGTPQAFVEDYFSTFDTPKNSVRLPMISQLTSNGMANLMILFFGILYGMLALNAFLKNSVTDFDLELLGTFIAISIYLLTYIISEDFFDSWVDFKMKIIHHGISLITGLLILVLSYLISKEMYTGDIYEYFSGYGIVISFLIFFLIFSEKINKNIIFKNRVYLRKFSRAQFVTDITPKIAIMSLILGVTGKIMLMTVGYVIIISGIIYFWAASKITEKNPITIESS